MLSGPARALGIEIMQAYESSIYPRTSGPARALGIEMVWLSAVAIRPRVGACEGPGD